MEKTIIAEKGRERQRERVRENQTNQRKHR